jgi:hypothetical protein
MSYYIWICVWSPEDIFIERVNWSPRFGDYFLGRAIKPAPRRPVFSYRGRASARKPDLVPGIQAVPVASANLRSTLERIAPDELELHPCRLRSSKTGETDDSFAIVQLLRPVAAMDRDRSEYSVDPVTGSVDGIRSLALDEQALEGRHLVRLDETGVDILVSESLRSEMEADGLTGMQFKDVADFKREIF